MSYVLCLIGNNNQGFEQLTLFFNSFTFKLCSAPQADRESKIEREKLIILKL